MTHVSFILIICHAILNTAFWFFFRDIKFGFVSHELTMQITKVAQPTELPSDVRILEVEALGKVNGSFTACFQFRRYLSLQFCQNRLSDNSV